MSAEFDLKRAQEKSKELTREQEQLRHNLMRTRRDEQYELDRLRREFNTRIEMIEARQGAIEDELKNKAREIERYQKIVDEEKKEAEEEERQEKEERSRQRLR